MVLRLSDLVLGEQCEGSNPLFSSLASRFSGVAIQISKWILVATLFLSLRDTAPAVAWQSINSALAE